MEKIVLSIGMIVKNEIRCLEKCLKALEPLRKELPCELVIGDTGSTDGTREIAAQYADIFFDLPWKDDFSAARNTVLAKCTGEWYLSLDADEYLDENIDDFVNLLLSPALREREENYGVITISNFQDQSLDKDTVTSFLAFRLARIRPNTHFVGKVHEKFDLNPSEKVINFSCLVLWHDGYAYESQEAALKKCERNMRLLREELRERPEDPLLIVQCVESSRSIEERLTYIHMGLRLIRSGSPGWELQGASLLRHAIQLGADNGLPELQEWAELAFTRYSDIALIQIDVNAILCEYYRRCHHWRMALQIADAYWEGIRKLDRGEFPIAAFAAVLVTFDSRFAREKVVLLQAESLFYLKKPKVALQTLRKVSLKTISPNHVTRLVELLAKLSAKISVKTFFCTDAHDILTETPSNQEAWRRREALRSALSALISSLDPELPCPYPLLRELEDKVYTPSATILSTATAEEVQQISATILDWRRIPPVVLKRLLELDVPFPQKLFQTMDLEAIRQSASYLVSHLEDPIEKFLKLVETLDKADLLSSVWRFELLSSACAWFKWKNKGLSERLYVAFLAAAENYLELLYPTSLLQVDQMRAALPQCCRFAYACIQSERQLIAGEQLACIQTLRDVLDIVPSMREMMLFLTDRVGRISEENRVREALSPELVTLAKQIRAIIAQYPKNDPAIFVLKCSEQYQKMKFLIEDPNLDNM